MFPGEANYTAIEGRQVVVYIYAIMKHELQVNNSYVEILFNILSIADCICINHVYTNAGNSYQ